MDVHKTKKIGRKTKSSNHLRKAAPENDYRKFDNRGSVFEKAAYKRWH